MCIEIKEFNNQKYINIKKYYEHSFFNVFHSTQELRGINKDFIIREHENKVYKIFINQQGFMEWFERKVYMDNKSQKIHELKEAGFLDKNTILLSETKATKFENDLELILKSLGIRLKREVPVDGYLVDFVIDDKYAVEYNENNHINYDKSKEERRYNCLKQHFDKVIIITDDNTNLENIAKVLGEIK